MENYENMMQTIRKNLSVMLDLIIEAQQKKKNELLEWIKESSWNEEYEDIDGQNDSIEVVSVEKLKSKIEEMLK